MFALPARHSSATQRPDACVASATPAASGTWKLEAGRALSLCFRVDARLQVAQVGLWVTLGQPPQGHGNESGDYFLRQGEQLVIAAGQHVVVEPWGLLGISSSSSTSATAPSDFNWVALEVTASEPGLALGRFGTPWQLGVAQPLADLRSGLAMAGVALLRLSVGLTVGVTRGLTRSLLRLA